MPNARRRIGQRVLPQEGRKLEKEISGKSACLPPADGHRSSGKRQQSISRKRHAVKDLPLVRHGGELTFREARQGMDFIRVKSRLRRAVRNIDHENLNLAVDKLRAWGNAAQGARAARGQRVACLFSQLAR